MKLRYKFLDCPSNYNSPIQSPLQSPTNFTIVKNDLQMRHKDKKIEELLILLHKAIKFNAKFEQISKILFQIIEFSNIDDNYYMEYVLRQLEVLQVCGNWEPALILIQDTLEKLNTANRMRTAEYILLICIRVRIFLNTGQFLNAIKDMQKAIGLSIFVKNKQNPLEFMVEFTQELHSQINQNHNLQDYLFYRKNGELHTFPMIRNQIIKDIAYGNDHLLFVVYDCNCRDPQKFNQRRCSNNSKCKTEVMGQGDNTLKQVNPYSEQKQFYDPLNLIFLSGMQIKGVSCFGDRSIAYDSKGNIYEWGKGLPLTQFQVHISKGKVHKIYRGGNFYVIENQYQNLFLLGQITEKGTQNCMDLQQLITHEGIEQFIDVKVGENNIILIDVNNIVRFMGDNKHGILGIDKIFVPHLRANILLRQITKCFNFDTCAFFINSKQELLYTGFLTESFQSRVPEKIEVFENLQIAQIQLYNEEDSEQGQKSLYVITTKGECYIWQITDKHEIKQMEVTKGQIYSQIILQKNEIYLYRSHLIVKNLLFQFQKAKYKSYETVKLSFTYKDKFDVEPINMYHPIRIYCLLLNSCNLDDEILRQFVQQKFDSEKANIIHFKNEVYLFELSNDLMKQRNYTQKAGEYYISFSVEQSDTYSLYIYVNEQPVSQFPISLEIAQSTQESLAFDKRCITEALELEKQQEKIKLNDKKVKQQFINLQYKELELHKKLVQQQQKSITLSQEDYQIKEKMRFINQQLDMCKKGGLYFNQKSQQIREENKEIIEQYEKIIQKEKQLQSQTYSKPIDYYAAFTHTNSQFIISKMGMANTQQNNKMQVIFSANKDFYFTQRAQKQKEQQERQMQSVHFKKQALENTLSHKLKDKLKSKLQNEYKNLLQKDKDKIKIKMITQDDFAIYKKQIQEEKEKQDESEYKYQSVKDIEIEKIVNKSVQETTANIFQRIKKRYQMRGIKTVPQQLLLKYINIGDQDVHQDNDIVNTSQVLQKSKKVSFFNFENKNKTDRPSKNNNFELDILVNGIFSQSHRQNKIQNNPISLQSSIFRKNPKFYKVNSDNFDPDVNRKSENTSLNLQKSESEKNLKINLKSIHAIHQNKIIFSSNNNSLEKKAEQYRALTQRSKLQKLEKVMDFQTQEEQKRNDHQLFQYNQSQKIKRSICFRQILPTAMRPTEESKINKLTFNKLNKLEFFKQD